MRLVGGKDYYDSVAAYGVDNSIVYVRGCEERHNWFFPPPRDFGLNDWNSQAKFKGKRASPEYSLLSVVFCGTQYCGAYWHGEFFWQSEKFIAALELYGWEIPAANKNQIALGFKPKDVRDKAISLKITTALFADREFYPFYSPAETWQIETHNLHNVKFFKVKDPHAAFQEISMWVGGVLTQTKEVPRIVDEKTRIEKRGFDSKLSFRTPKRKA